MNSEISKAFVLDAWPVLEWLKSKQPAAVSFRNLLQDAEAGLVKLHMCRLNFGEVVYRIRKDFHALDHDWITNIVRKLPVELHSVSDELIDEAVLLKSNFAISYADAFAAAFAVQEGSPLVTGDRDFLPLQEAGVIKVHWLGA